MFNNKEALNFSLNQLNDIISGKYYEKNNGDSKASTIAKNIKPHLYFLLNNLKISDAMVELCKNNIFLNLDNLIQEKYYEKNNGDANASTLAKNIYDSLILLIKELKNNSNKNTNGPN